MQLEVEPARAHDLGPALELLLKERQPTLGVAERFGHFLVVRDEDRVVGLAGLFVCGDDAMLHTLAVDAEYRGQGLGRQLMLGLFELAKHIQVGVLYVSPRGARDFFLHLGCVACPPAQIAPALLTAPEVQAIAAPGEAWLRKQLR